MIACRILYCAGQSRHKTTDNGVRMIANPVVSVVSPTFQQRPIQTGHEGHFVTRHVLGEAFDLFPVLGLVACIDRPSVFRPVVRFRIEIQEDRSKTVMSASPIVDRHPQGEGVLDELHRAKGGVQSLVSAKLVPHAFIAFHVIPPDLAPIGIGKGRGGFAPERLEPFGLDADECRRRCHKIIFSKKVLSLLVAFLFIRELSLSLFRSPRITSVHPLQVSVLLWPQNVATSRPCVKSYRVELLPDHGPGEEWLCLG